MACIKKIKMPNGAKRDIGVNISNVDDVGHNSIYRGKNLTNVYTLAQLHEKVSAGDFEDLFLGDYWNTSKGIAYMIYGFNPMYNQGDTTIITQPHIGLIARSPSTLPTAKYAETTGATGGYVNSYINDYITYTESVFAGHAGLDEFMEYLLRPEIYVSSANDNNGATGNSWMTCKFWLPSDAEICGYPRAGTPTAETAWGYSKLPVFNYISPNRFGRSAFWTRTLASGGNAIRINNNGIRGVATKTSELGVRPCMIFG